MTRIAADTSRTGPSVKGTRRIAILLMTLPIIVVVAGTAMNWPAASSAQVGLVRLYGEGAGGGWEARDEGLWEASND